MPLPSSGSLRIAHVLSPARFGGIERVVESLAIAQRRGGHNVQVIVSVGSSGVDHPLSRSLRQGGVPVHEISLPSRAYVRERRVLHRLFGELTPEVVHSHGYRSDVLAGSVARRLGIATVATAHGFAGGGWRNRAYEWLECRMLRSYDAVVAVSRPLVPRLQAEGIVRDRIHCIPNAWAAQEPPLSRAAARQRLGIPDNDTVVGWVGRLSQEKGPDVMLEALAALPAEIAASLVMVGAGGDLDALRRLAARLGVAERVHWAGEIVDANRIFRAFDAFALSSRTEGTPMVLLEAMEARVPIVATKVGGVGDVIGDVEGLLVPPEDPAALSSALRAVLLDRSAAQLRAERAAERLAREFTVERWIAQYDQVYRAVLLK